MRTRRGKTFYLEPSASFEFSGANSVNLINIADMPKESDDPRAKTSVVTVFGSKFHTPSSNIGKNTPWDI